MPLSLTNDAFEPCARVTLKHDEYSNGKITIDVPFDTPRINTSDGPTEKENSLG
jgi:hypothetical protein